MEFIGATPDQQSIVNDAVTAATKYIADAHQYVASGSTGARYTTWFGQDDPQRRAFVESVLANLSKNNLTNFIYDCTTCTDPTLFCYVYPEQLGIIYLGPSFWKIDTTGADSQAGFLISEASKFLENGGTQEHKCGQEDCQELARVNPADAITNANNYGYFAENDPPLA